MLGHRLKEMDYETGYQLLILAPALCIHTHEVQLGILFVA